MGIESISLACEKPVYYAGELISGYCTIVVTRMMQIPVIHMQFQGKAHVEWTESRSESYTDNNGRQETRTVYDTYHSHQEIVCVHRDLVVQGGFFQPGTYSLPFAIDTPCNLTSSFEGQHGSVRYYVKAKKPGNFCMFHHKVKTYVCILQPIDTNIPMYLFPVSGCDNKTICCLCCASGPLTIEARCDRAAYCPGEIIYISAHFDNKSSRHVRPYVRLVQRQQFYAQGSRKYGEKKYDLVPVENRGETIYELGENASADWDRLAFAIPPCYPSLACEIINVSYLLEVCMEIPMAFDLRVSLPIIMATIPYRGPQVVTVQPGIPTGWSGFGAQTGPHPDAVQPPPISAADRLAVDAPPPSYFQTVFNGDASIAREADARSVKKN